MTRLLCAYVFISSVSYLGERWKITAEKVSESSEGEIKPLGESQVFYCKFVAVATGHHTIPSMPVFPDQDKFKGMLLRFITFNMKAC